MEYLNEIEQNEIQKFLENITLKEAVRKVILSGVYFDGIMVPGKPADPLKNFILGTMTTSANAFALTAEKGMRIQSIIDAIAMVESGFRKLEELKLKEPVKEPVKVARHR